MSVFQGSSFVFLLPALLICLPLTHAGAYTWRVPSEHPSICGSVDSSAYGDTVLVEPGTYEREIPDQYGAWIVMKDGITLMSETGPEETFLLDDPGMDGATVYCPSIVDAEILGLGIRNTEGSGCHSSAIYVASSQVYLRRNVISGPYYYGIRVWGESPSGVRPMIFRNEIRGCYVGVEVSDIQTLDCPYLKGNHIASCVQGMDIWSSSPELTSNTIQWCTCGIWFDCPSFSALRKNKIINNDGAGVIISAGTSDPLPRINPYGWNQDANDICGNGDCIILDGPGENVLNASYNYWGTACPDSSDFMGNVDFSPWITDSAHTSSCNDCETCMAANRPVTWSAVKALFK